MNSDARAYRPYIIAGLLILVALSFTNLDKSPTIWFDEGAHLHVPKTLVQEGVYAEASSEGFRFDGPVLGVGPTVMLPIAAVFRLFGVGLWQARFVIVIYMLAATVAFFFLSKRLSGVLVAVVATLLLVSSRGSDFLMLGRQVLGEIPGLAFMLTGVLVWSSAISEPKTRRLLISGLFFGLAMVTKYQNLLLLGPTFIISFGAQLVIFKENAWRSYAFPLGAGLTVFALWQALLLFYIQPNTFIQNLETLREASAGAAFTLSPALIARSIRELFEPNVYFTLWLPGWLFGIYRVFLAPKKKDRNVWLLLWSLVTWNLVWYVTFSIGWLRYTFPSLSILSLFIAEFFSSISGGFRSPLAFLRHSEASRSPTSKSVGSVTTAWLGLVIMIPFALTVNEILHPAPQYALAMARYMEENVSESAVIETWEPEMGFLTDYSYHYPPNQMLAIAIKHVWLGDEAPSSTYQISSDPAPDYVLTGEFSDWVEMYDLDLLKHTGSEEAHIGPYRLIKLSDGS